MSFPHIDPKDIYGQDLIKVFGPKTSRRHISTLTPQEKEAILDKVPEYIETDDLGPRPSFFQVTNKILWILQQTGALQGIDLDWCPTLTNRAMHRHPDHYFSVNNAYKNNSVQRGIWLKHLLKDILFQFDPDSVLMGLARKLSDGTANFNNGQHRTVGCIIIGIREVPIEWQKSDLESVDVDEYATDNLHTLSASPYDEFRIQVRRNQIRKAEGRTDLIEDDKTCEDIFDIHARYGSRFVEKGQEETLARECTGVGNMIKYYDTFGKDIYERAVSICCSVFSRAPLATGNAWGLMEFLREQTNNGSWQTPSQLDWAVQQALLHKYQDPRKNGMHLDIKKAFAEFLEKSDKANLYMDCPEPRKIAGGILKMCQIVHPDLIWAPINYSGKDLQVTIKNFHVMPRV
jgi:hypothetical protein